MAGAVHAFDNAALVSRRYSVGDPLMDDPAATADSERQVQAFLARCMPR